MSRRMAMSRAELEFEPDQEQQQHDAELGRPAMMLSGVPEYAEAIGADDDAGDEIGDDRREPELARDRHADHGRGEQHEGKSDEADLSGVGSLILRSFRIGRSIIRWQQSGIVDPATEMTPKDRFPPGRLVRCKSAPKDCGVCPP